MKLLVISCSYTILFNHNSTFNHCKLKTLFAWRVGPIDKASDLESEDCGFDPHHVVIFLLRRKHNCKQLLFHEGIGCIKNG